MTGRRHARGGSGDSNFSFGERGLSFGQQSGRITERLPAARSPLGGHPGQHTRSRKPATALIPTWPVARPWYLARSAPLERGNIAQSAIDVLAVIIITAFVSLLAASIGAALFVFVLFVW